MPGRAVAAAVLVLAVAAACTKADDIDGPARSASERSTSELSGSLRVSAASSLTEAFGEIGPAFEALHPGVHITFNFGASSTLAEQVKQGAPTDVFVSADERVMQTVVDTGRATAPRVIARNRLALLVEKGNPKALGGLADLDRSGVSFVLCAPQVPCGRLGAAALRQAGVVASPVALEENVKAVVARVVLGEADAGIVYATDVAAARGQAQGVPIDVADDPDLRATYQAAVTLQAQARPVAPAFVDFVLSAPGQATLGALGFLAP